MRINISEKIKQLRISKKRTQEDLAEQLNVSIQAISRWETSATYPDLKLLPEIANIFEISVDELLGLSNLEISKEINK